LFLASVSDILHEQRRRSPGNSPHWSGFAPPTFRRIVPFFDAFEPGWSGSFDSRFIPLSDHDNALALVTREYHILAQTLLDGAAILAGKGKGERAEKPNAMMLAPALALFAKAWRAGVDAGTVTVGRADPISWLRELILKCEFADAVCTRLICAAAGGGPRWYQRQHPELSRLIRGVELPEVPLLASEILDVSDFVGCLSIVVQETVDGGY
jgi:hypothetical protein